MDMCVQLWLRSATIDDVLEFLHHAPLPEKGAEELCLELSSFKKNKKPSASATPHPGDTSSSNGGDAKLFSHFFYWGMLIGCGDCRNVHPAGVGGTLPAEEKQRRDRARAAEQGLFEDVARSAAARGGRHSGWDKDASGGGGGGADDEEAQEEDEEEDYDEMRQMVREVHFLRLEGSQREADLLDKEIKRRRQEQLERVRNR
jgi:hypothetical protein